MEHSLNIKITDLEVLRTEIIVQNVRNGKFLNGLSQKKEKKGRKEGKENDQEPSLGKVF